MTTLEIVLSIALVINCVAVYRLFSIYFRLKSFVSVLIENNNNTFEIFVDTSIKINEIIEKVNVHESKLKDNQQQRKTANGLSVVSN